MELFEQHIAKINTFLDQKARENMVVKSKSYHKKKWPRLENKPLVLMQDTAVELGHPQTASTSMLLWNNDEHQVHHKNIFVIGKDLPGIKDIQSPFGKIVMIAGYGFDEENSYERYRALEQIRYRLFLKGYMMRGASQLQREWSRVSTNAIKQGFSFQTLGSELINDYLKLSFVKSVQIIFITSSNKDVSQMNQVSTDTINIIAAMNKMTQEMSFDCDACEYVNVCKDVAALRTMRLKKNNAGRINA